MDGKTVLTVVAVTLTCVSAALSVWGLFFGGPPLVWLTLPLAFVALMAYDGSTDHHWYD